MLLFSSTKVTYYIVHCSLKSIVISIMYVLFVFFLKRQSPFLISIRMLLLIQGRSRGRIITSFFVGIDCSTMESKVSENCFAYKFTSSVFNVFQLNSESRKSS